MRWMSPLIIRRFARKNGCDGHNVELTLRRFTALWGDKRAGLTATRVQEWLNTPSRPARIRAEQALGKCLHAVQCKEVENSYYDASSCAFDLYIDENADDARAKLVEAFCARLELP